MTFGALMAVWVMLWGSLAPSLLLVGAVSAVVVLWLFPLPPMECRFGLHPWRALILLVRFLGDVVLASLHVAALALRPRLPRSAVIEVQLANDSDLLQHLTGLAVSLVPGSLIIDADPQRRTLLIHLLDVEHDPVDEMTRSVLAQEERIRAALAYSPRSEPARVPEPTPASSAAPESAAAPAAPSGTPEQKGRKDR